MTNLIAIPLGWVMWLIYKVIPSYGLSILLFTLFVKLLTLPSTYKLQVNSARMALLAPKLEKIKKAFPNNPTRVQEEQTKLYGEEGINTTQGCLGSLVTMFLLLGVYRVVMEPLKHILRISADEISRATKLLTDWLNDQGITEKALTARPQLVLMKYARGESGEEIFKSLPGFTEKLRAFNNTFLGFDLTGMPETHPENGWSFTAVMLLLLPILAALAQLAITIVTQAHSKKTNPSQAQQMGAMNIMLYMTPLMTIWIGLSVPAGLSFYWLINSLLSLVMTVGIYRYLSGERMVAINEKEKEKQLKKGPGWMQRMMEQSAQMQQAQQGTTRTEANRTRYCDGDDGMSRKERAEYDKKLIEAARRRAAEKYGDAMPDDQDQK